MPVLRVWSAGLFPPKQAKRIAEMFTLWAGPGFGKMIQDHKAIIKKFPHRVQKSHQVEFDVPFDPEK